MNDSADSNTPANPAMPGRPAWLDASVLAGVDDAALAALAAHATRRAVSSGEVLVRQGDPADTLFLVETGRFRVLVERGGQSRLVAQIEAGEPIGELAFFGGGTRTATVQARRDSVVLALDRAGYDAVASAFPSLNATILRTVAQRLAAATAKTGQLETRPPRVLALLPAGGSTLPPDFLPMLAAAMRRILPPDRRVATMAEDAAPPNGAAGYQDWLREQERAGGYTLVDASGSAGWSELACRNADGLVLVAWAEADPALNPAERAAFATIDPVNRTLVRLRSDAGQPIRGTQDWLKPRSPHRHVQTVAGSAEDMARLARFLTGRAVGLVLAGGGALGCAHLGIIEGLQRGGVPIDYIGGTSAGAAMGGAIAQGLSPAETLDQVEAMFIHARAMKRLTVPVHSLLDPRVFDAELRARYSNADIADQPTGFFAISTNLSTNDLFVHRHGPLWEAVRASGSLPTILPPFIDGEGNVLVDGGVLDNVPVMTMRGIKTGPNIVVTLGDANQAWRIRSAYESLRGPGRLLWDVVTRRKPSDDFPSIVEVMQRSMVVASRIASRSMLRDGDILLAPPIVPGMQILDWHRGREQAAMAAAYVADQLAANPDLAKLQSQ